MNKYLTAAYLLLLTIVNVEAQYADPNFAIPTSGYGSDGSHSISVETLVNLNFIGHPIKIYHPTDVTTPVPTIFYSHAYGGTDPDNVAGVLEFIAKKGYAVVFVPYQTANTVTVPQRYETLITGFRRAAQNFENIIDTTRVGFLGHSFGGGASFGISYELFEDGWGENGRFIYALAQWYTYIDAEELSSFPDDVKLLFEIFNDDVTNDHRMAVDIFNHINTPADEKDFLVVSSSAVNGYNYVADHVVPNIAAAYDALDYYAYYRLLDALCDYTFNGNLEGKNVALGHGSPAQVTMPEGMGNLQEFEHPTVSFPQDNYLWKCSDDLNPRIDLCNETVAGLNTYVQPKIAVYPNPSATVINVQLPGATALLISIYNSLGQLKGNYTFSDCNANIDISNLQRGVYFVFVNGVKEKFIKM